MAVPSISSELLGFASNHHLFGYSREPPRNGYRHYFSPAPPLRRPLYAARWSLPQSSSPASFPANLPSLHSVDSSFSPSQPASTLSDEEEFVELAARNLSPRELTMMLKRERSWRRALRLFRWARARPGYNPNPIHYNVVLRALGRAREWDELRRCWIAMARDGVLPTNNTYAALIDVYDKAGLRREALLWLRHMRSRGVVPDEVTMNTVVRVLKDSGRFAQAETFFRGWCDGRIELDAALDWEEEGETGSSSSDAGAFSPKQFILTELFRSGGRPPVSGIALAEQEPRKPKLAATYNTLIDLYGKAGKLSNASDAFAEMLRSGVTPDTTTFNTMINVCGTHGNLAEAEALLVKMEERRILPDTKTFNIFMSLYSSVGNLGAVIMYYRRIADSRLKPDSVTHRIILQELCKRNMVEEAEKVIKELEKSHALVDEQLLPVIVKMYADGGLLEQGKKFLEKHCFQRTISSTNYAAIMNAYAERGLWMEAEHVFYESPVRKKDVVEYNVMIKAYGKGRLYDKALQLFESMACSGTWPDLCTYNSLIQMLAGADMPEKAKELLNKMQQIGFSPQCEGFSATIASLARADLLAEAEDLFNKMKVLGVEPNEVVYGSLINAFAESGKVEDALHYFRLMKRTGVPINQIILTSLVKGFSKVGCWQEADELYSKMKGLEGGPDTVASNCMINLFARLGMVAKAERIFIDLRERGHADGITYATMMHLYKSMGMLNEAVEVAWVMQQAGLLVDCASFNNVLAVYAAKGMLRECGELLHQMQHLQKILPDKTTFKTIFTILRKGGIAVEAVYQLEASYLDGKPYARQAILTCLFAILGMQDLAMEYCTTFLKSEASLDIFAYNVAIYVYGTYGKIDDASNLLMRMQDEGHLPDIVTYINLAHCYGKAGMIEGIKRIYSKLKYGAIDPNESLFNAVINAYRSAGKPDLAALVDQEMRYSLNDRADSNGDIEKFDSLNPEEYSDFDSRDDLDED